MQQRRPLFAFGALLVFAAQRHSKQNQGIWWPIAFRNIEASWTETSGQQSKACRARRV
jgi:hypothetical protein